MSHRSRSHNQQELVSLDPVSGDRGGRSPSYRYTLRCLSCGIEYPPHPFRLHCDRCRESGSLLRTVYSQKQLQVKPQLPGIFRYIDWLPVNRALDVAGKPIVYQSQKLAAYLGLERLYICFNGYWHF
jgi:cysteate synthase